jgi:hypothetical protein
MLKGMPMPRATAAVISIVQVSDTRPCREILIASLSEGMRRLNLIVVRMPFAEVMAGGTP